MTTKTKKSKPMELTLEFGGVARKMKLRGPTFSFGGPPVRGPGIMGTEYPERYECKIPGGGVLMVFETEKVLSKKMPGKWVSVMEADGQRYSVRMGSRTSQAAVRRLERLLTANMKKMGHRLGWTFDG